MSAAISGTDSHAYRGAYASYRLAFLQLTGAVT
jgi:hypothetical protein